MNWEKKLRALEEHKEWDLAIRLMEEVIKDNPDELDAYLSINYLIMNLLVEEDYDFNKHDEYENILKKYYDVSYKKFSDNAEYLFYTALTMCISPWFVDIDTPEIDAMLVKALELEPKNVLYKWIYYTKIYVSDLPEKNKDAYDYALMIMDPQSPIKKTLDKKGSLGEYLLGIRQNCARKYIAFYEKKDL